MAGSTPFVLPGFQGTQYDIQRQQALAQALMQSSLTPQQTPQGAKVGPYQVQASTSPIAPLAQILQAGLASKAGQDAGQNLNQLGRDQYQALTGNGGLGALSNALGNLSGGGSSPLQSAPAGQPVDDGTAGVGGLPQQLSQSQQQQQQAALAPGGALNPLGMPVQQAAMMLFSNPDKYWEVQAGAYKPTDATLMARAGGVDTAQANRDALFHANYVAPITGTGTFRDPRTMQPVAFNPDVPSGTTPLFDATGNVAAVRPIQGAQAAMQGNAAATAAGGAQFKPIQVYNSQTGQMEYANEAQVTNPSSPMGIRNNNPGNLRTGQGGSFGQYPDMQSGLAALDGNLQSYGKQGINTISGVISKWAPPNENDTQGYIKEVSQRLGIGPNQKIDLTNPLVRQSLSTAIALRENGPQGVFGGGTQQQSGRFAAGAPLGAQTSAERGAGNQQDELSTKYKALSGNNSEAQNTISYLQSIKDLSTKAATGQQSDRLNYINGLLSLAGSEKATDAVTANDLLKKYSNQIVARLSSNGMGTDAARSILESAYPNAKMTSQAINDAADNLIGAQQMTQAKMRLLTPLANSRDATGYNNAELKFDQNADPRIFQYANIQDPSQRQAFAQKLIKQDPKIVQKIKNLEQMGAF